ncbi:peptidoglycan binding protein CsiV [Shewanella sp. Isolate7]|uniref:peptidoglycan binding protein CsiV n=1 Tax=Shewanella sp. Isolate7 TaxID=2908528 RepID=UPI001EFCED09|nr:peptidoglycan binding protein CsiV [Shewanella sp. Isolate7]
MLKKSLLLVTTLASLSGAAWADNERWFEVEVYLFERQGSQLEETLASPGNRHTRQPIDMISPLFATDITGTSLGLEGCNAQQWLETPEECDKQLQQAQVTHPSQIPATIGAPTPQYATLGAGTVLLADSQSQFGAMIDTLKREAGHKSLLHMTWQQSMLPRHQAKPVRLYGGEDYSDRFNEDGYAVNAAPQLDNSDIPQFNFDLNFEEKQAEPIWALDGTLNIYLNHYLYVETALTLHRAGSKTQPQPEDETLVSQIPYLHNIYMTQNKRVKSDEIHYFDHPNMGMILQIRKMEQPGERPTEVSQPSVIPQN